jgi:hypothetical protein
MVPGTGDTNFTPGSFLLIKTASPPFTKDPSFNNNFGLILLYSAGRRANVEGLDDLE